MATTLQVLRVGLDVELNMAKDWDDFADASERTVTLSGFLRADTLAETKELRRQLLNQVGRLGPIVSTCDDSINGFYILLDADITASHSDGSLQGKGLFRYAITALYKGSFATAELQSLLSLVSAVEDFSTTPSYWWAPAIGAQAVDVTPATATEVTRDGEDGTVSVATEISAATNPKWSVDPTGYYGAAVALWAGDRLQTGLEMPMDVTDWYLTNSLMEVRPATYQGTSTGVIETRFHDGTAWGSWVPSQINWAGTNMVPSWNFVTVIRNTAEACTIRLTRDAAESPFSQFALHELDLTLRRGGRFVTGLYKFTGPAATHAVEMGGTDTVTRPLGASYVSADTLVDGDRILYGSPRDFTLTGREIQLDVAATSLPFWLGAAVDNATTGSGNGPGDLAEQYVGQVAESVRAVRR